MEEIRVKLPEGEEVFGVVEQMLGCRKMYVKCSDGVRRLCRVPGRYARKIWVKPGDVVIVKPWEIQKDRGDVIFKYTAAQIDWLKRKGYLKFEEI
ncbi:MAG: translation initiation factor eIF-1A [Nanoarchaeota archaeon]|nr:translation initiation factor eIF-1A [Nanoarchaeota archaeon]HDD04954.1 translation initiation factor eIF-1A [Candidatus Aenigmarchaeota archaeon]